MSANSESTTAPRDNVVNMATRHRNSIANAITTFFGGFENKWANIARQSRGPGGISSRARSQNKSDQTTAQEPK